MASRNWKGLDIPTLTLAGIKQLICESLERRLSDNLAFRVLMSRLLDESAAGRSTVDSILAIGRKAPKTHKSGVTSN
jgi:hypothetical protein